MVRFADTLRLASPLVTDGEIRGNRGLTMKRSLYAFFTTVFVSAINANAQDLFGLTTSCSPDGVYENVKKNINERKYWVAKHVEIGMYLANLDTYDNPCTHQKGTRKFECESARSNFHRAAYACFVHTARMCNLAGGNCSTNLSDYR